MNGLILTTSGAAEIEAAYQNGQTVTVRHVLLGDGGGQALPSTPDEMAAMTSLYGEFGLEPFSDGAVEEGFISGDIVIDCKSYPGKTLRELGIISDRGTLIAYGRYPDTFLPDQTDSVIKEVILTLVLGLTHAQNVVLEVDPDRAIITQEIGDRRYLQRKKNLSDVEDKDESVENLGLKPTVDKAKNAVQRGGDTMSGELKIRGDNALRIFDDAFGLIFRRSEDSLHLIPTLEWQGENGNIGTLRPFSINLRTGDISMSHKVTVGGGSLVHGNSVATGELQSGNGSARIAADGNVYGSTWGGWLSSYLQNKMGVQDVRLGGYQQMGSTGSNLAPSGYVSVGGYCYGDWDNSADGWFIRPLQKLINGTWYNVASM